MNPGRRITSSASGSGTSRAEAERKQSKALRTRAVASSVCGREKAAGRVHLRSRASHLKASSCLFRVPASPVFSHPPFLLVARQIFLSCIGFFSGFGGTPGRKALESDRDYFHSPPGVLCELPISRRQIDVPVEPLLFLLLDEMRCRRLHLN